MTAKEFIGDAKIYFDPTQFNIVLNLMEGYSKHMCKKQREICAENAKIMAMNHSRISDEYKIDMGSIINSPLPKELQ